MSALHENISASGSVWLLLLIGLMSYVAGCLYSPSVVCGITLKAERKNGNHQLTNSREHRETITDNQLVSAYTDTREISYMLFVDHADTDDFP